MCVCVCGGGVWWWWWWGGSQSMRTPNETESIRVRRKCATVYAAGGRGVSKAAKTCVCMCVCSLVLHVFACERVRVGEGGYQ